MIEKIADKLFASTGVGIGYTGCTRLAESIHKLYLDAGYRKIEPLPTELLLTPHEQTKAFECCPFEDLRGQKTRDVLCKAQLKKIEDAGYRKVEPVDDTELSGEIVAYVEDNLLYKSRGVVVKDVAELIKVAGYVQQWKECDCDPMDFVNRSGATWGRCSQCHGTGKVQQYAKLAEDQTLPENPYNFNTDTNAHVYYREAQQKLTTPHLENGRQVKFMKVYVD